MPFLESMSSKLGRSDLVYKGLVLRNCAYDDVDNLDCYFRNAGLLESIAVSLCCL